MLDNKLYEGLLIFIVTYGLLTLLCVGLNRAGPLLVALIQS